VYKRQVPFSSRRILLDKLSVARRVMNQVCVLFAICAALQMLVWWFRPEVAPKPLHLGAIVVFAWVMTRLTPWLGMAAGVLVHHPVQSMVLSGGILGMWMGMPLIGFWLLDKWLDLNDQELAWQVMVGVSPISGVVRSLQDAGPDLAYAVSLATALGAWYGLRRYCLSRADRILGRAG
jgi:hypothetical protein